MNLQCSTYFFEGIDRAEFTSSISVAEIGEPPNVTEADSEAETGKEKLNRIVPLSPVSLLISPVIRVVQVLAEK